MVHLEIRFEAAGIKRRQTGHARFGRGVAEMVSAPERKQGEFDGASARVGADDHGARVAAQDGRDHFGRAGRILVDKNHDNTLESGRARRGENFLLLLSRTDQGEKGGPVRHKTFADLGSHGKVRRLGRGPQIKHDALGFLFREVLQSRIQLRHVLGGDRAEANVADAPVENFGAERREFGFGGLAAGQFRAGVETVEQTAERGARHSRFVERCRLGVIGSDGFRGEFDLSGVERFEPFIGFHLLLRGHR